jgi:hypothetical protein
MKINNRKDFISAIVFGIIFLGIIVGVQPYPMESKRLLVFVSFWCVVLAVIIMVQAARPKKEIYEVSEEAAVRHGGKKKKEVPTGALMGALAWVVGVLLIVYLLGFQFGLPLYILLYYRFHGGKWLGSILMGCGILAFVYLFFHVLLDTITPPGLLFELFAEYFGN